VFHNFNFGYIGKSSFRYVTKVEVMKHISSRGAAITECNLFWKWGEISTKPNTKDAATLISQKLITVLMC
jgi:hypothetical protein